MFPINGNLTRLDIAFPSNTSRLMPRWEEIPEGYQRDREPSCKTASTWFYEGLSGAKFVPREGVDETQAMAQLKCILGSFEPKHEHKIAAVAYLIDQPWSEPCGR